ncbi:MAG: hypothetical protein V2A53_08865 [bacterium]
MIKKMDTLLKIIVISLAFLAIICDLFPEQKKSQSSLRTSPFEPFGSKPYGSKPYGE